MREKGFTFIELIVSMAILAILLGIAIPNFTQFYSAMNLNEVSDQVAVDIGYARDYASKRDRELQVTLNEDDGNYSVSSRFDGGVYEDLLLPSEGDNNVTLPATFTLSHDDDGEMTINFTAAGTPEGDEDITFMLSGGSETKTIVLHHKTGLVTVE